MWSVCEECSIICKRSSLLELGGLSSLLSTLVGFWREIKMCIRSVLSTLPMSIKLEVNNFLLCLLVWFQMMDWVTAWHQPSKQ